MSLSHRQGGAAAQAAPAVRISWADFIYTLDFYERSGLDRLAVIGSEPGSNPDAIDMVEWWSGNAEFDLLLHHGPRQERNAVLARVAARDGPIVGVHMFDPGEEVSGLERLVVERVVSVNTAAAGGNATLMTVG